jgi:hypothetical protein
MKRLRYLLGDVEATRQVVGALHQAGFDEPNIMVVARDDIALGDLPRANIDRTDAMPGLARGLAAGAVIGAIAGFVALEFNAFGSEPAPGIIVIFAFLGALISGFATLIGGASLPNTRLQPLQDAIERGRIVLMVDVDGAGERQIKELFQTEIEEGKLMTIGPGKGILPP